MPPANQSPRTQMNARACLNCHVARARIESSGRREVPALTIANRGEAMKTKQHSMRLRTCVLAVRAAIVSSSPRRSHMPPTATRISFVNSRSRRASSKRDSVTSRRTRSSSASTTDFPQGRVRHLQPGRPRRRSLGQQRCHAVAHLGNDLGLEDRDVAPSTGSKARSGSTSVTTSCGATAPTRTRHPTWAPAATG